MYLPQRDFAAAKQVALDAERQGFYSVSINDHFVSPDRATGDASDGVLHHPGGGRRGDRDDPRRPRRRLSLLPDPGDAGEDHRLDRPPQRRAA